MNPGVRYYAGLRLALLDLLTCLVCFTAVSWLFGALAGRPVFYIASEGWIPGLAIAATACWYVLVFFEHPRDPGLGQSADLALSAAGLTLLVEFGAAYVFLIRPLSPWVIVPGAVLSIAVAVPLHGWFSPALSRRTPGVLFVGFDPAARILAPIFRDQVVGVLDSDPARVPPEWPFLGDPSRSAEIVQARRPGRIIVSERNWRRLVQSPLLLNLQDSGALIEGGEALCEDLLGRVCWAAQQAVNLLFSARNNANRLAMAVQAVYTNLIGLALLLASIPLLIAGAALIVLDSGGPVLDRVECLGLQRVGFDMLRFRTRRGDGGLTRVGKVLQVLHLANLPRLINLVRGEMVLFGPPPVRREFAARLSQIIPVYPHRFTVKPGVLGWSQAHLRGPGAVPEESLRLEYDLYYLKQNSPSLDFEILIRTLFPALFPSERDRDAAKRR